jgi:phosphohistidine swiveling domain-containing protein
LKTLAAIRDEDLPFIGGKAASLSRLVRAGFPVPEAAVLDTRDIARFTRGVPPPDLAAGISRCAGALRARGYAKLAVRSSALGEDSSDASFAGMFETVLNVPAGDFGALLGAIRTCLGAANSERAIAYRKSKGLPRDASKMALVIQAMIPGDASGVLFTLDPLRGLDTTHVLEGVGGTGEKLVGGTVTPERAAYDWRSETLTGGGAVLTPDRVRALSDLALGAQREYGYPLDLEWTIAAGKIFLLQARPITRVFFETKEDWTNANMKDGGVSSSVANPFIASQYRMMMNRTMPDYFTSMRMLPTGIRREWSLLSCGHLYWNLSATKLAVSRLPGFIEREFDEGLGIAPNYSGTGKTTPKTPVSLYRGMRVLSALKRSLKLRPAASEGVIRHSDTIFTELTLPKVRAFSDTDLATRAERLIEVDWLMVEGGYFYHIYDNSNCRTLFIKALEKRNRKSAEKVSALDLVTGLGEIPHLAPLNELWALSRKVRADAKARDFYTKSPVVAFLRYFRETVDFPFAAEMKKFVADYRYRSPRELDLRVANWDEDPTQVFESLRGLLALGDDRDPRPAYARQAETYARARAKITKPGLLKLLDAHRALLKQRETLRIHSIRTLYLVRLVYLEIGRRLVTRGVLKSADDIFYLEYPDAVALFRGEKTGALGAKLEKNRTYTEGYRNFRKPNEIRKPRPSESSSGISASVQTPAASRIAVQTPLEGVGCSPGTVEGEVCVIKSVHDLSRLKPSSILVTEFVDPAWTISFIHLKGLITETGGVLSHGAVIAREYGFPAILAVPDALSRLQSGARIRMDGASGKISVLGGPAR